MADKIRRQLTFSNVISVIALFAALGLGTAFALQTNSVKSKHIVNNQVKGVDVREGTLEQVPNAETLDGLSMKTFRQTGTAPLATPTTALSLDSLRLVYVCDGNTGNQAVLVARTTASNAFIIQSSGAVDGSFNVGDDFQLVGDIGTATYTSPVGQVVTFNYRHQGTCSDGAAGTAYGG